jgi:hypothetical protein
VANHPTISSQPSHPTSVVAIPHTPLSSHPGNFELGTWKHLRVGTVNQVYLLEMFFGITTLSETCAQEGLQPLLGINFWRREISFEVLFQEEVALCEGSEHDNVK